MTPTEAIEQLQAKFPDAVNVAVSRTELWTGKGTHKLEWKASVHLSIGLFQTTDCDTMERAVEFAIAEVWE